MDRQFLSISKQVESWNGTTWTETTDLNKTRWSERAMWLEQHRTIALSMFRRWRSAINANTRKMEWFSLGQKHNLNTDRFMVEDEW